MPIPDDARTPAVLFVRLDGHTDLPSSAELASGMDTPDTGGMDVVLDLREVTVLPAESPRVVTELAERLAASGRRLLVVAGSRPQMLDLSLSGDALRVFATVDEAVGSLRRGPATDTLEDIDASTPLADVLSSVARTLEAEPDLDATLLAIVKAALTHVPGAEHAGISLVERGRPRTVAPSAELVRDIDEVQYHLEEGPCVDAIADHRIYRTGDLAAESRWPAFGPAAAEFGVRSMLSYRLFVSDTTLGALNL